MVHAEYQTPVDQKQTITQTPNSLFCIARHTNTQESITLMNDGCYSSGSTMICFSQTLAMAHVEDLSVRYINEEMKGHFIHLGIRENQMHLMIRFVFSGFGNCF
jgi:hypothetical protein